MSNHADSNEPSGSGAPFASVAALKSAHADLLSRYHEGLGTQSVHDNDSPRLQALLPLISDFIARGRITGQLIDAEDERAASQAYLDYWVSVIYRAGLNRDDMAHYDATLADFDPHLAPDIPEDRCPYIGLDAFQEQNKDIFYGRKTLVAELLTKIGAQRLLAIIGPSGSGKSSTVLAGLLPALKSGALRHSEDWNYFPPMVPSANPLRSLALAVGRKGVDAAWVEQQVELFKRDASHLRKLFEHPSNSPAVLVVDQFEEVFTLCNDEVLLESFINNLLGAVTAGTVPHRIVMTIRIEFQEQMPLLETLYPLFLQGLVQVVPLSVTHLRDAIDKPAAEVGLRFEQGIVDNLVKEIVGEPAGLPLLQFTLLQLWRRRRRNRVLLDDYNKLGGARKALTNVASDVYAKLPIADQVVAKRIFLRLAWAGEGVEVLRNRVLRRYLHKAGGAFDQVDLVLRKLVAARLIRLTRDEFAVGDKESLEDQFEVAHEALIRNWQMLIDWLQAERETLRHRIRVRSAAEQWKAHGWDPGGLLGGSLLAEASKYTDLEELERKFITASQDAEEASTREREAIRLREVAHFQALAAEKSRAARRLKYFAAGLAALTVFATAAAFFAIAQSHEATGQARFAKTQQLEAFNAAQAAKREQEEAKKQAEFAEEARSQAVAAQKNAEAQKVLASTRLQQYQEQKMRAEAALRQYKEQKMRAEAAELAYITRVGADRYRDSAEFDKAEEYYVKSLELITKAVGSNTLEFANVLYERAESKRRQGSYSDAEQLYNQALSIRVKFLGQNHRDIAAIYNDLGTVYYEEGNIAKSEEYFRKALDIFEKKPESNSWGIAVVSHNFAEIYRDQGQYKKSEDLYKKAIELYKNLGEEKALANCLNSMGRLYRIQGNYSEAERLIKIGLSIREKILSPRDPGLADSLSDLAALYVEKNEYIDAEQYYKKALDIVKILKGNHPLVAYTHLGLGWLYYREGKYTEAESEIKQVLTSQEQLLGPSHPNLIEILQKYAAVLRKANKLAEAEKMEAHARAIQDKKN